jgi:adenosylhomocysteine nucleosidase
MSDSPVVLGIVAALPAEARAAGARVAPAGETVTIADGALLVRGGVGRGRAWRAAADLLDAGAGALLSWGTAAALAPGLRAGDLVLPEEVLTRDGSRDSVDGPWRERVAAAVAPRDARQPTTLAEAEDALKDADDKRLLHTLSGASAADMESAAIAEACAGARVPLLVVRAVSDSARTRLPDCALAAMNADGDVSAGRCLGKLLAAPGDLPALVGLATGFRAACRSLSRVAGQVGPGFLAPGSQA